MLICCWYGWIIFSFVSTSILRRVSFACCANYFMSGVYLCLCLLTGNSPCLACLAIHWLTVNPRPNGQIFEVLFVKHNICWFGNYTNRCLTNIFCDKQKMLLKTMTSKMCLSSSACRGCQMGKYVWWAKFEIFGKQCLSVWPGLRTHL